MIGEDDITSNDNNGEHVDVKKPVRGKRAAPAASDRSEKKAKPEPPGRPLYSHWLMKSEPESRLENGIDVKARWSVPRWPSHSLSDWISSHIGVHCVSVIHVYVFSHFHLDKVWYWGFEGSPQSDRMLGWCSQLSGRWTHVIIIINIHPLHNIPIVWHINPNPKCICLWLSVLVCVYIYGIYSTAVCIYLTITASAFDILGTKLHEGHEAGASSLLLPQ